MFPDIIRSNSPTPQQYKLPLIFQQLQQEQNLIIMEIGVILSMYAKSAWVCA